MTRLFQIVPNLPPSVNGVGDYALMLAGALRREHGIETTFLVANPAWSGGDEVEGFQVARLDQSRAVFDKVGTGEPPVVLLHYVGYGYAPRGAPMWLARWLRALLSQPLRPRLMTFFHELYAVGPPWRSSFWLSPLQRLVCRRIARLCDLRMTNRGDSAATLDAMSVGVSQPATLLLPVFSNFGEPNAVPPLVERPAQLAIYGGICRYPQDAELAADGLRQLCAGLGIQRVVSFGKTSMQPFAAELPVENRGLLSADEVSSLLLESRAGYLDYPQSCLGKSTIFASFCSHGALPTLLHSDCVAVEGLRRDESVFNVSALPAGLDLNGAQRGASAAHQWYHTHSLSKIAQFVARAILNRTPASGV